MRDAEHVLVQEFLRTLMSATEAELVEKREEVAFDDHKRLDTLLRLRIPHQPGTVELAVEAGDAIYPRDARRLVEYLALFNERRPPDSPAAAPVVAARHLTSAARRILKEAGSNYFEASSGSLFFRYGTWLIDIDRPSKQPLDRKIGSIFNGARERVVHALLMHRYDMVKSHGPLADREWMSGTEVATKAETSTFTVSTTLQELEKHDWVETSGSGPSQRRRLKNAEGLLDAWSDEWTRRARSEPRTRWYTYAGGRGGIVDKVLEKLDGRTGWAMSGAAAANAILPHLTAIDRVLVIVPPGMAKSWADEMNLEQAEKGSNITFVERSGASLQFLETHPERPGSYFASPFIQYLDLLDGVGRNKELAREYRTRVLNLKAGP